LGYQVEGLVRDNRVEVRVLFGALRKPEAARTQSFLGWRSSWWDDRAMRLLARLVLGALALAGVAVEVVVVGAGASVGSAVLDLAAGWLLLAAAAGADALRPGCRVLTAVAAGLWFAGTLGMAEGGVGRVADLWASLYSAPLVGALLAAPGAWPRRAVERALVVWTWVRGVLPVLAVANVATLATGAAIGRGGLRAQRARSSRCARASSRRGVRLGARVRGHLAPGREASGLAAVLVSLAVAGCGAAVLAGGRRRLSPGV
jgi:hypothetical protein